jgi:hypothetical protein
MAHDPDTCDLLCLDLPKAERVRKSLPGAEDLEVLAAGAKALGDPQTQAGSPALSASAIVSRVATSPGSLVVTSGSSPTTFVC